MLLLGGSHCSHRYLPSITNRASVRYNYWTTNTAVATIIFRDDHHSTLPSFVGRRLLLQRRNTIQKEHQNYVNLWVWNHRTSLSTALFIEVSVPSQESEWSCICVRQQPFSYIDYSNSAAQYFFF
jgi:hypothetical protein